MKIKLLFTVWWPITTQQANLQNGKWGMLALEQSCITPGSFVSNNVPTILPSLWLGRNLFQRGKDTQPFWGGSYIYSTRKTCKGWGQCNRKNKKSITNSLVTSLSRALEREYAARMQFGTYQQKEVGKTQGGRSESDFLLCVWIVDRMERQWKVSHMIYHHLNPRRKWGQTEGQTYNFLVFSTWPTSKGCCEGRQARVLPWHC